MVDTPPVAVGDHRRMHRRPVFWLLVAVGLALGWALVVYVTYELSPGPSPFDPYVEYHEDFSDGSGGLGDWDDAESAGWAEGGGYHMRVDSGPGTLNVNVAFARSELVDVSARMGLVSGDDDDSFGLFALGNDGEYVRLTVSPKGSADITGPDISCKPRSGSSAVSSALLHLVIDPTEEPPAITGYVDGAVAVECRYVSGRRDFVAAGAFVRTEGGAVTVTMDDLDIVAFPW